MNFYLKCYLGWLNSHFQKRDPNYKNFPFWDYDIVSAIEVFPATLKKGTLLSPEALKADLLHLFKEEGINLDYPFFGGREPYEDARLEGMYWFNVKLLTFLARFGGDNQDK